MVLVEGGELDGEGDVAGDFAPGGGVDGEEAGAVSDRV